MKKRIRIISLITAIILLVLAITSAVILIPDRDGTEETEGERVIADTENSVGSIPPISQDENADIRDLFTLSGRVSRYASFSIEKKTAEIDSVSYDVYELKGSIKGLTICIR